MSSTGTPYSLKHTTSWLRIAAAGVALAGLLVAMSWFADWERIFQFGPGAVPMEFNTAVCFLLCGIGAGALTTRFRHWAAVLGAITAGAAIFTRMSPLTTVCFTLLAAGLIRAGIARRPGAGLQLLALLATSVLLLTGAALTGLVLGIDTAFGWGVYTRMAVQTAVVFFILALALGGWAWRSGGLDLARWLPATASVTVMGMVALGSAISQAQLENAVNWDKHTYEVLLTAQTLLQ